MASIMVNPTRMELTKLKKKLITARRGHKLLKDKRDELMRQFLELIKDNMALREKVESGILETNRKFVFAKAIMGEAAVNVALLATGQRMTVEVKNRNIMSVLVPEFDCKAEEIMKSDMYRYGFAFTSQDLDFAVRSLSEVFLDMLKLAEVEKTCQLMASEIEKTRRRVNALEHVVIPETQRGIRYITMKLDENERSTQVRLMKVKDMMIRELIGENKYLSSEK
ncbi:MAG: V-type ATP synthase subunit D [Clostridia bacterium]|nr:V-type ATP synthase subunit D [Clostridia bacterium]